MAAADSIPFFSIIIPTRNRPALFREALQSVLEQTCTDREVLAVLDGSEEESLVEYRKLESEFPEVRFLFIPHREFGHGQSYSMNQGITSAHGRYFCFLDDDDHWTDNHYLERAKQTISASENPVQLHYSNQKAFYADGSEHKRKVWLEDLIPLTKKARAHVEDSFFVDANFLMASEGFAHLNCSIFQAGFFRTIGGMDESIRYENDRDVYLRAVDQADTILFSTRFMSRHNIPEASKRANMSTVASALEKKLYQIRVYDKGACHSKHTAVAQRCQLGKTYELKHVAEILAEQAEFSRAAFFAREALTNGFNLRWLGYTLYLGWKSLTANGRKN